MKHIDWNKVRVVFLKKDEATIYLSDPVARIWVVYKRRPQTVSEIFDFNLWEYSESRRFTLDELETYWECIENDLRYRRILTKEV